MPSKLTTGLFLYFLLTLSSWSTWNLRDQKKKFCLVQPKIPFKSQSFSYAGIVLVVLSGAGVWRAPYVLPGFIAVIEHMSSTRAPLETAGT